MCLAAESYVRRDARARGATAHERRHMREFTFEVPCEQSAATFWALRSDVGFDRWFAALDRQDISVLGNEESTGADGLVSTRRLQKLSFRTNPIPKPFRRLAGLRTDETFAFHVKSSFWTTVFDEQHPYVFQTTFPGILASRVVVCGRQWCVPVTENSCKLMGFVQVCSQRVPATTA